MVMDLEAAKARIAKGRPNIEALNPNLRQTTHYQQCMYAFQKWAEAKGIIEAYEAGHAAADTDATRKLARMVELAGVLRAEAEHRNTGIWSRLVKTDAASRIRAIVEE